MNGMVIEYTNAGIRKALATAGVVAVSIDVSDPSEKDSKSKRFASEGKIIYDGAKVDLSEWYETFIGAESNRKSIPRNVLFHKDDSWQDEKEYRFVFRREDYDCNWFENLEPKSIYIGYRMEENHISTIKDYCKGLNIPLYRYTPDFHSESSKKYYRDVLFDPHNIKQPTEINAAETTE